MDKWLVGIGIAVMMISIGFGLSGMVSPEPERSFYVRTGLWAIGGVALILGLTVLSDKKWYYYLR